MKKILSVLVGLLLCLNLSAQTSVESSNPKEERPTVKVYCEVMCVQYNLFKADVNALVDFGIADKAKYANGWIYDTDRNKKTSFASPMSVFAFMAKRGWEYKDAIVVTESSSLGGKANVWHFILTKDLPYDYTAADVIGDIDYRNK